MSCSFLRFLSEFFCWFVDQGVFSFLLVRGRQVEKVELPMPCGIVAAGVVVGDDDLLIFASGLLRHTVGASGVEDIKLLVQLHDEWAVVIGHHDISLTLQQSVVETLMIFLGKHRRITVLCIVVGRIKIKKCVWPVVLVDDFYAVLVFDDDICQPAGALPNQIEETADIAGFSGKGLGAAAEAVSNQLEKVGSAPYVTARRSFQHHSLDGLSVRKLQIPLRQLQLLFQIVIGEFLFGEELIQHIEIVACIQRQKPQLQQERHGPVFDTTEQVGQVAVEVVVDLHTSRLDGAAQGYCAAAAEHINKT